jgi:chromosome partitioning protein
MHTILIFSGKGGAAKTTLARELAVAGSMEGHNVALTDLDPQAGMTGWFARRAAETPVLVKLAPGYDFSPIERMGIDELIIDLPPGAPNYVPMLIAKADVVLVPVRPSPDDLTAAAGVVGLLAGHPSWAFVLTQTLPRSRLTIGALQQLAALGRVAPVTLGSRQDYPLAAINGQAAVEFPSTKSAEEIKQLRAYVNTMMGLSNGKKT